MVNERKKNAPVERKKEHWCSECKGQGHRCSVQEKGALVLYGGEKGPVTLWRDRVVLVLMRLGWGIACQWESLVFSRGYWCAINYLPVHGMCHASLPPSAQQSCKGAEALCRNVYSNTWPAEGHSPNPQDAGIFLKSRTVPQNLEGMIGVLKNAHAWICPTPDQTSYDLSFVI